MDILDLRFKIPYCLRSQINMDILDLRVKILGLVSPLKRFVPSGIAEDRGLLGNRDTTVRRTVYHNMEENTPR